MNKTAIKNFAIWARNKLIADIKYKAGLMGITEKGIAGALPQSAGGTEFYDIGTSEPYCISGKEIEQRRRLKEVIENKAADTDYSTAYKYVIEEVAYTWFNRLIAVRFMEVNDYLPGHIRVLSSETGKMEPDLVTTPFDSELEFTSTEEERIIQLKQDNKIDELFRMLFIKQCNALNELLPALFEKTNDYTEILLNFSVIDQEGVVYRLVHDIPEEDFDVNRGGQVEIIGWLYQYYNTEPKNDAFAKKGKITKEEIPAVTQLFTPDWIVRYMVENSLGRLWLEGHPDDILKANWKYYLDEAEQDPEVQSQLDEINKEHAKLNPEDIKLIDPCMGSGHILVYAFDVFMQIYESVGWSQRDAAKSILENNIFGLDIDDRAGQMAYFAVMMKARQYNRKILSKDTVCNVFSIQDSNGITSAPMHDMGVDLSREDYAKATKEAMKLVEEFHDAKEYGSIITVKEHDWELLKRFAVPRKDESGQMTFDIHGEQEASERIQQMITVGKNLSQKYEVVITNPPYAAMSGLSERINTYVKEFYPSSKGDFFAVFIEKGINLTVKYGMMSLVTPESWMFLSSFEKLRLQILNENCISTMLHLGRNAFECGFGTSSYVIRKNVIRNFLGVFEDLTTGKDTIEKKNAYISNNAFIYKKSSRDFIDLPNHVIAYWCSNGFQKVYSNSKQVKDVFPLECGIKNGNNDLFLRAWFEVELNKTNTACDRELCLENLLSGKKWFRCNKGGGYKKWYGNYEYVLNLENDAADIKRIVSPSTYRLRKKDNYFWETLTWPLSGGKDFGCRFMEVDTLPDVNANIIILNSAEVWCLMGYMNTKVFDAVLNMLNPTTNFPIDTIGAAPYRSIVSDKIESLVKENVSICKTIWNLYEESWNFTKHPLVEKFSNCVLISDVFLEWRKESNSKFIKLKENEEELNRIYIEYYGLQDELSPYVEEKDVTLRRVDLEKDIKNLISYAVGCMLGRFSLDCEGLAYAGGILDASKYATFIPDVDGIIPITDEEYFEDDIVGLFCAWLKKVYGEETLEENLDFIAKVLGKKGNSSREIIRNYFLTDFYKDHCSTYSVTGSGKRPIYWLFDSGKQNGFKALIYLHRYTPDTIGNLRVDYLHRMQRVYESEMNRMQDMIEHSTNSREVAVASKRKEKLQKQLKECREYDEKIGHLALDRIELDLDDGVKYNYRKIQTGRDGKFYEVLADSKSIMMDAKKYADFKK